jgi:hypothetical protein
MNPTLLRHDAMFYSGDEEYVARVREFVLDGLEAGGGVLVAVPEPKLALLQDSLSGVGGDLHFVDMRLAGVNPARIIPFIKAFVDEHPDVRVAPLSRVSGECRVERVDHAQRLGEAGDLEDVPHRLVSRADDAERDVVLRQLLL